MSIVECSSLCSVITYSIHVHYAFPWTWRIQAGQCDTHIPKVATAWLHEHSSDFRHSAFTLKTPLSQIYFQTLVETMPHRIVALLRARGGCIRYVVGVLVFLALQCIINKIGQTKNMQQHKTYRFLSHDKSIFFGKNCTQIKFNN